MGTSHAMGEHGWAWVAVDGYGLGMGTNSKENVRLCSIDFEHSSPLST